MVGFDGSRFFLRSLSLAKCNKWCSTVLYGYIQCLYMGGYSGSILFLWRFRVDCPVLRQKMLHVTPAQLVDGVFWVWLRLMLVQAPSLVSYSGILNESVSRIRVSLGKY